MPVALAKGKKMYSVLIPEDMHDKLYDISNQAHIPLTILTDRFLNYGVYRYARSNELAGRGLLKGYSRELFKFTTQINEKGLLAIRAINNLEQNRLPEGRKHEATIQWLIRCFLAYGIFIFEKYGVLIIDPERNLEQES